MKNNGISVICVDLNETLVKEQTWPELNFAMGMTPEEDSFFYNQHKEGKITYSEWVNLALDIYRERGNPTKEAVEDIIMNYTYYPFAKELIEYLQQKYTVILISGAMDLLVQKIAAELKIEYFKSLTKFHFDRSGYISKVSVDDRTGDEAENKVLYLQDFCGILGFQLENVSSIGDGGNDHQLFRKTKGITFNRAKKEHKQLAWKIVPGLKEITEIL
ncbi:hypothetical protein C0583_03455 [Candidatus Parcubacteria bacterium]|mgnify:CR=1 FL=1|nr:MAG: hypothetical protein C0583_03455 [Candidatus Parcubacteria bacterium]